MVLYFCILKKALIRACSIIFFLPECAAGCFVAWIKITLPAVRETRAQRIERTGREVCHIQSERDTLSFTKGAPHHGCPVWWRKACRLQGRSHFAAPGSLLPGTTVCFACGAEPGLELFCWSFNGTGEGSVSQLLFKQAQYDQSLWVSESLQPLRRFFITCFWVGLVYLFPVFEHREQSKFFRWWASLHLMW